MPFSKELLKGSTDTLLLSLIKRKPVYGYELIKEIERRSQGYFRFREGTLYPALHRLEREGLVEGKWEQLPNGQERRYYYITPKGESVLASRLAEWQGFSSAVDMVMGLGNL